jgi:chromosome segregation protein
VGAASRLLARAVVVPDLDAALALQAALPAGWLAVLRDGSAVVDAWTVRLGRPDAALERRAEADRLRAEVARLGADAAAAMTAADDAAAAAAAARNRLDEARAAESRAVGRRRAVEETERAAARTLEAAAREAAWQAAQAEAVATEVVRLAEAVGAGETGGVSGTPSAAPDAVTDPGRASALAAWEARAAELRSTRDRLATDQARFDAARAEQEARRARAEAAVDMDGERMARAERELAGLSERERRVQAERDDVGAALALAVEREAAAATALEELRTADAAARERLAAAEREASGARERLRASDDRLRAADRADLEARLGRDALREQLLVELAGLGGLGLARLRAEAGGALAGDAAVEPRDGGEPRNADEALGVDADDDAVQLERALAAVAERWAADVPPGEPPSAGRLASLRRRYHELGAANPFAVEEYAEVRARLETLEAQGADLRQAIVRTRELIAELNTMIADQFRSTFRALEAAFDERFRQLFGGGYANLVLTDPGDLSATGIEIVARPPGKKQQALAMLSGGERALTAVALLFAMLQVRPVPFCVLDEVDAALDEANVGRFTGALQELAERTQFIVITHNRGTIEAADALYGVTVGDDSVSRVISLRLDEAQAIADRRRDAVVVEAS